ncbi:MAG: hypothetical protein ACI9QQ_002396, partial [Myxococcota bacterium]
VVVPRQGMCSKIALVLLFFVKSLGRPTMAWVRACT